MEAVLMITPRSPSSLTGSWPDMTSAHRRSMLKVPIRLTAMPFSKSACGNGPFLLMVLCATLMPAQLTLMCTAPNLATAAARPALMEASSVTLTLWNRALSSPSSATALAPSSSLRSNSATLAPSATNMSAVPRPRPDTPPEMTATLSFRSMISSFVQRFELLAFFHECGHRGLGFRGGQHRQEIAPFDNQRGVEVDLQRLGCSADDGLPRRRHLAPEALGEHRGVALHSEVHGRAGVDVAAGNLETLLVPRLC